MSERSWYSRVVVVVVVVEEEEEEGTGGYHGKLVRPSRAPLSAGPSAKSSLR